MVVSFVVFVFFIMVFFSLINRKMVKVMYFFLNNSIIVEYCRYKDYKFIVFKSNDEKY